MILIFLVVSCFIVVVNVWIGLVIIRDKMKVSRLLIVIVVVNVNVISIRVVLVWDVVVVDWIIVNWVIVL